MLKLDLNQEVDRLFDLLECFGYVDERADEMLAFIVHSINEQFETLRGGRP